MYNFNRIFTPLQVQCIREMYRGGYVTQADLCRMCKVSLGTIRNIVKGSSYRDVPDAPGVLQRVNIVEVFCGHTV